MPRTIDHSSISTSTSTATRERRHHHRGLDAITQPGDGDVARPVGDPGKAGREHRYRQQEQDDPDHGALTVGPSARAVSAAN